MMGNFFWLVLTVFAWKLAMYFRAVALWKTRKKIILSFFEYHRK